MLYLTVANTSIAAEVEGKKAMLLSMLTPRRNIPVASITDISVHYYRY